MTLTTTTNIIKPNFEAIPNELKQLPQWVLWRAIERKGKITKTPFSVTGSFASTTNPNTWASFQNVYEAFQTGQYDGIGFVFTSSDDYIGLDLDGHFKDGEFTTKISSFLSNYSYTEISPSGTGLHIIFKGKLPEGTNSKNTTENMEIYSDGRYFTFTGEIVGNNNKILNHQNVISNIAKKYFFQNKKPITTNRAAEQAQTVDDIDDSDLFNIMFNSKQGQAIQRLFNGDTSEHNSDHSSADQALCNHLAFYTAKNAVRMDNLFRQSGLYRDKWDKKHSVNGQTYGEITIQKAISDTNNTYSLSKKAKKFNNEQTNKQEKKEIKQDIADYFDGKKFIPVRLAKDIMNNTKMIFDGSQLYLYQNGVYRSTGEMIVRQESMNKLGELFKKSYVTEVIYYIETATYKETDNINKDDRFINVKNGLLDWRTGKLYPHNPDIFTTIQLPVEYNPAARCPNTEKFLHEVVPEDTIQMLYEWFGYCMIPSTRYEKALMLTGSGSNGKSKFIELFERFLGTDNLSNIALQDLEHNRFKLAQLYGKLANTFADIPAASLEKSSVFKTIVSGDRTSAEFKGRDSFDFKPFARLLFSANELPRSADLTHGFFRRWLIVPFPYTFGEGGKKADTKLINKITTNEELSGLLNLAIEGLKRLDTQGHFTANETTTNALESYKKEIDNVATFLDEMCVIGEEKRVTKQSLYHSYDRWCFDSGYKTLGKYKFYARVENKLNLKVSRTSGNGERFYQGIGLINPIR